MAKKRPQRIPSETPGATTSKGESVRGDTLRRQIERIDQDLIAMVNKRATLVRQLDVWNMEHEDRSTPLEETSNVDQLLQEHDGPLSDASVRSILREVASGCRALVHATRVAYLGPSGSYSHQAAVDRFGTQVEYVPLGTIAAVFEEVASHQVEFGIVPLENSTDGRIADTLSMFMKAQVKISGEINLRIHHQLIGLGPRTGVRCVCSKPQAISQCREWLAAHLPAVEIKETASTTAAAELAAADAQLAAIASRQAAVNYGLRVLASNIEDNPHNVTRFAILSQTAAEKSGHDKTALLFELRHEPGALSDVLAICKRSGLNLTWIESFPLPGRTHEYFFFAEFQGHASELRVRRALASVAKKTESLTVLGSYEAAPIRE